MNWRYYLVFLSLFFLVTVVAIFFVNQQILDFKYGPAGIEAKTLTPLVWSPEKESVTTVKELKILVVGDIMLDRSVFLKTKKSGDYNFPFLKINSWLKNFDLRIGNLEGPITDFKSVSNGTGGSRLIFTFSPNFLEPLKNNFDFFSLANNHTSNFGAKGLQQTRSYLETTGIKYFGGPNNHQDFLSTSTEKNGIKISFIGYHGLVRTKFSEILAEIQERDLASDFVIVYPHWGEEYNTKEPTTKQKTEARQMIDAGADVVVGSHPHVVEPEEEYQGKKIFYSLGNFIFDQYFSKETMEGMAVGIEIKKDDHGVVNAIYKTYQLQINSDSQPYLKE